MLGVHSGRYRFRRIKLQLDLAQLELWRHELLNVTQEGGGFHGSETRLGRSRELEEVPYDLFEAIDFIIEDGIGMLRRAARQLSGLRKEPCFDGRQRIANLMRHARRKHAEGGKFFLARDDTVTFDELILKRNAALLLGWPLFAVGQDTRQGWRPELALQFGDFAPGCEIRPADPGDKRDDDQERQEETFVHMAAVFIGQFMAGPR